MARSAIVIGGGFGGLTAAIALIRLGIRTTVYEKEEILSKAGAAISFAPNAVACLDALGVGEAFRREGHRIKMFGFRDYQNNDLFQFDMHAHLAAHADGLPYLVLPRHVAQSLLIKALPEGTVILGKQLSEYTQGDDGKITARFRDGTVAGADFLIGADGLHSVVREQMIGDGKPNYVGYTVWRAISGKYRFSGLEDIHMVVSGPSNSEGRRLFFADLGDRYYWFWAKLEAEGGRDPSKASAKQRILQEMREGGWHEEFVGMIDSTDPQLIDRRDIYVRDPLTSWSKGNVILIGDAAHPMTPEVGQGAAMAIEDAKALADCISLYTSAGDMHQAFKAFEEARIPRTTAVAGKARMNGALLSLVNPIMCWLRGTAVRWVGPKILSKQTFIWAHKA